MITDHICLRDCRLVPEIRATTSLPCALPRLAIFHTPVRPVPGVGAAIRATSDTEHHINIKLINSNIHQLTLILSLHEIFSNTFLKYSVKN